MDTDRRHVLLVENNPTHYTDYRHFFSKENWSVFCCANLHHLRRCLENNEGDIFRQTFTIEDVDIAVVDFDLGDEDGILTGDWIHKKSEGLVPILLFSGEANQEDVRRALIEGAIKDYASKSEKFEIVIKRCLELFRVSKARRQHRRIQSKIGGQNIAIDDQDTVKLLGKINRYIAKSMMPVMVLGASGTGKETMAREVHDKSGLESFRALNCAAFTEELIMSEIFGHVKGTFTGANDDRMGVILEAAGFRAERKGDAGKHSDDYLKWLQRKAPHQIKITLDEEERAYTFVNQMTGEAPYLGTLFLDEVAELTPLAQAAFLRFLDGYGFRPVGYYGPPLAPKLRIVSATNRFTDDVAKAGKSTETEAPFEGRFRQDLYWRLAGWTIPLKPITELSSAAIKAAAQWVQEFAEEHKERLPKGLFLNEGAINHIIDRIAKAKAGEHRELLTGNFRALRWWIKRACWATWADNDGKDEITETILEEAYEIFPSKANGVLEASRTSLQDLRDTFRLFMGEKSTGPSYEPEDEREAHSEDARIVDINLLHSLCSHLNSIQSLTSTEYETWRSAPDQCLELSTPIPDHLIQRWRYIFLLGTMDLAVRLQHGKIALSSLQNRLGRKVKDYFHQEISDVLGILSIEVEKSPGTTNPRNRKLLEDLATYLYGETPRTSVFICKTSAAQKNIAWLSELARTRNWDQLPRWKYT